MTDWKTVYGSQTEKPLEFDTASSKIFVYQHKNIERVTVENSISGGVSELWQYEERKLSREEYAIIIAEVQQEQIDQNRADLDFISAMTGVEL